MVVDADLGICGIYSIIKFNLDGTFVVDGNDITRLSHTQIHIFFKEN